MFQAPKHYRTRGGKIARVYATDGETGSEIHGALLRPSGKWEMCEWRADGSYFENGAESGRDLIDPATSIPEVSELEAKA